MRLEEFLNEKIKIWLDDERKEPKGWKLFKTVPELIKFYKIQYNNIEEISLDHDLGENTPEGYKFLEWLEKNVISGKYKKIPKIEIHSANPIGKKRMLQAIQSIKKKIGEK